MACGGPPHKPEMHLQWPATAGDSREPQSVSAVQEICLNTLFVHHGSVKRAPALRGLPAVFRSALDSITRGWMAGDVTFVTPDNRVLRPRSEAGGPTAIIRIHDFRFVRRDKCHTLLF